MGAQHENYPSLLQSHFNDQISFKSAPIDSELNSALENETYT